MQKLHDLFSFTPDRPLIFSSGEFFVLFFVFICIYGVIYKNVVARLSYVLLFSCLFYYKSSGLYVLVLLGTIFTDYFLSLLIYNQTNLIKKRIYLVLSLVISLGVLFYFKYTNFLLSNIGFFTGMPVKWLDIVLPIGISFYTFQSISYLVDVYKGEIKPQRNVLDYCFYMTFFPHLVAGPIVRAKLFLPQIRAKLKICNTTTNRGLYFIIKGLVKKALIADYIAGYNDLVFLNPENYGGFEILIAIYGYALQIYCDFSGYSDMAIGIAWIMGYDLGINFNSPYQAQSITEFWRKWHISLSLWLRDYVYIPLGGGRVPAWRKDFNLFLTMLIGGFWHGASWKFVFWGAMHGAALVIQKHLSEKTWFKKMYIFDFKPLAIVLTFHFVVLLWVYFRAESFEVASMMIAKVFSDFQWSFISIFVQNRTAVFVMIILGLFYQIVRIGWIDKIKTLFLYSNFWLKILVLLVTIQLVIQFKTEVVQPFIYFQF